MSLDDGYDLVSRAIKRAIDSQKGAGPRIVNYIFFGEEDPAQLVIYLAYEDAKSRTEAEKSGDARRMTQGVKEALQREGYPPWSGKIIVVSEEEVNKAGGPWDYFQ